MHKSHMAGLALICVCAFLAIPVLVHAQPPVAPPVVKASKVLQRDGLTAVIAAPTEVCLHKSRSFPVVIRVISLTGRKLPDTVRLRAFGKIESGGESAMQALNIKLKAGGGRRWFLFLLWSGRARRPCLWK